MKEADYPKGYIAQMPEVKHTGTILDLDGEHSDVDTFGIQLNQLLRKNGVSLFLIRNRLGAILGGLPWQRKENGNILLRGYDGVASYNPELEELWVSGRLKMNLIFEEWNNGILHGWDSKAKYGFVNWEKYIAYGSEDFNVGKVENISKSGIIKGENGYAYLHKKSGNLITSETIDSKIVKIYPDGRLLSVIKNDAYPPETDFTHIIDFEFGNLYTLSEISNALYRYLLNKNTIKKIYG